MMVVNLNVHSYYTISGSLLSVQDIVDFSLRNHMTCAALTDVNNMFAAMEFFRACQMAKIKPIIGLEATVDQSRYVFLAKNNAGYVELANLSFKLLNGRIDETAVDFVKKQNVFVIHKSGPVLTFSDDFYSFDQNRSNRIAIHTAKLLSNNDRNLLNSLALIQANPIGVESFSEADDVDYELWSEEHFAYTFDHLALDHLSQIIAECNVNLSLIKAPKLQFPFVDENTTAQAMLEKFCLTNLKAKGIDLAKQPEYAQRLKYEISILKQFGFIDYFLIVWDLVNYAHNNDILIGPGRGSSAGSLVAYALKITAIDPLKYGLIFERFLNPERISMPDIDLDITDSQREKLLVYLRQRYGSDKFALISTFQKSQAKRAIRDAGQICNIREGIIEEISKGIKETEKLPSELARENLALRDYVKRYPSLFTYADKLFDLPRQISTHAAGVVINQEPLKNFVPLFVNTNGYLQTQFSYQFLEQCGLVKIDLLGLKNLAILNDIVKQIAPSAKSSYDYLLQIPLNDPLTMNHLSHGLTFGIFQLESPGMTELIQEIRPNNIEELATTISLYRPGPLRHRRVFSQNARNSANMHYIDDRLQDILKSTNGIIIYQEQIIRIVKKVANFSNAQADLFRRAISKKEVKTMQKLKSEFIKRAVENHYLAADAENIYHYIETFAEYGFNHSHAVSYAFISYWMAYLKFHYPLAFFASWFNHNSLDYLRPQATNSEHPNKLSRELDLLNVRFRLPTINDSTEKLTVWNNQAIQLGFNVIKGLNSLLITKLLKARNERPQQVFSSLAETLLFLIENQFDLTTVRELIAAKVLRTFEPDNERCFNIYQLSAKKTHSLVSINHVVRSEQNKKHSVQAPSFDSANRVIEINRNFLFFD